LSNRALEQFAEHQPVLVGDTQAANQTRPAAAFIPNFETVL
jgi:hypothetical protein